MIHFFILGKFCFLGLLFRIALKVTQRNRIRVSQPESGYGFLCFHLSMFLYQGFSYFIIRVYLLLIFPKFLIFGFIKVSMHKNFKIFLVIPNKFLCDSRGGLKNHKEIQNMTIIDNKKKWNFLCIWCIFILEFPHFSFRVNQFQVFLIQPLILLTNGHDNDFLISGLFCRSRPRSSMGSTCVISGLNLV